MAQSDAWFTSKRLGWGWAPITWQGWLVTLALVTVWTVGVLWAKGILGEAVSSARAYWLRLLISFGTSTALFVWVAVRHGGWPHWRL